MSVARLHMVEVVNDRDDVRTDSPRLEVERCGESRKFEVAHVNTIGNGVLQQDLTGEECPDVEYTLVPSGMSV